MIFSKEKPIWTSLVLMLIAVCFKLVDHFVLRLDERLGEIILSKSLGFVLVVLFVWLAGRKLRDIGFHTRFLGRSILIGSSLTLAAFLVAYGVAYVIQYFDNAEPALLLDAIDSKVGVSGGLAFGLWLMFGNCINAFMEEGLFRGVMIRLFRRRLSFWGSNWLQACLFGIWHLPWVIKYYQLGTIETPGEVMFAIFSNSIPQLCMGLVWGYLYLKTDNLWAPWIAHLLANTISNLLHITSLNGLDSDFSIRMAVYTAVVMLGMLLVKYLAARLRMPEVKPWGEWSTS